MGICRRASTISYTNSSSKSIPTILRRTPQHCASSHRRPHLNHASHIYECFATIYRGVAAILIASAPWRNTCTSLASYCILLVSPGNIALAHTPYIISYSFHRDLYHATGDYRKVDTRFRSNLIRCKECLMEL